MVCDHCGAFMSVGYYDGDQWVSGEDCYEIMGVTVCTGCADSLRQPTTKRWEPLDVSSRCAECGGEFWDEDMFFVDGARYCANCADIIDP